MISLTIHVHIHAPVKPALGQPCNGCGLCCLYEPCPLGRLLSRRRTGACMALRWDEAASRYRCGALSKPHEVAYLALPGSWRGLAGGLAWLLRRGGRRWIAAGRGCDCSLEPVVACAHREPDRLH